MNLFGMKDVAFPSNPEKYMGYLKQIETDKWRYTCVVKKPVPQSFTVTRNSKDEITIAMQQECAHRDIRIWNLMVHEPDDLKKKQQIRMILGKACFNHVCDGKSKENK